jgi:Arc/MetJ family transcription regulator
MRRIDRVEKLIAEALRRAGPGDRDRHLADCLRVEVETVRLAYGPAFRAAVRERDRRAMRVAGIDPDDPDAATPEQLAAWYHEMYGSREQIRPADLGPHDPSGESAAAYEVVCEAIAGQDAEAALRYRQLWMK